MGADLSVRRRPRRRTPSLPLAGAIEPRMVQTGPRPEPDRQSRRDGGFVFWGGCPAWLVSAQEGRGSPAYSNEARSYDLLDRARTAGSGAGLAEKAVLRRRNQCRFLPNFSSSWVRGRNSG